MSSLHRFILQVDTDVVIRQLSHHHIPSIIELNRIILQSQEVKKWYTPIFDENLPDTLHEKGFGLGAFYKGRLIGYRLVRYVVAWPGSLALELDLPANEIQYLAQLAGIAVLPEFNGLGIASRLFDNSIQTLLTLGFRYISASCHVENEKSLNLLLKNECHQIKTIERHGHAKHLLFRNLI